MTSFVHARYPQSHAGVKRFEAAVRSVGQIRRSFNGARMLAAMLLASVASALIVVADQVASTWAEGNLLAAWVLLWAIGFTVLAAFAQPARRVSARMLAALDAWSAGVARARADQHFWQAAQDDPRVLAELRAALSRDDGSVPAPVARAHGGNRAAALRRWHLG